LASCLLLPISNTDPFLLVEAAARGRYIVIVPRSVVRDAPAPRKPAWPRTDSHVRR
jgi:DNA-binding transcriptional LysR family regulator